MTPVVGAGVSIGTVALVGGVFVIAGVVYLLYKNNNKQNTPKKGFKDLISDEDRIIRDKRVVINAIEEKDWEILEELLNDKNFQKYPDLITMIKKALEERK
jgi:uncharacterized membrane protein